MTRFVEINAVVISASASRATQTRMINPALVSCILPVADEFCRLVIGEERLDVEMTMAEMAALLSDDAGEAALALPPGDAGTPLSAVKGIGEKTEALLMSAGISNVEALAEVSGGKLAALAGGPLEDERAGKAIVDGDLVAKARAHLEGKGSGLADLARRAAGAFKAKPAD